MIQIALIITIPPLIFLFGLSLEHHSYAKTKEQFRIDEIVRRYE